MTVLLIDNYDSFTYNLYQYFGELGVSVDVRRNDRISVDECVAMAPSHVVISPGPGNPSESGISCDVIRAFAGKTPVLGVCLGHQCIYEVFGGKVDTAGEILHGKISPIHHKGEGVFKDLPDMFKGCRYHSLAGVPETQPEVLAVTATTESGIIMGVRHKELTVEGVQFHPESIGTEYGHELLKNFLTTEGGRW